MKPLSGPGALAGLRVLDLTMMLSGPYCTMLLADQGADVVKVEPLDGDHTRIVGPYRADDADRAYGGYFASINRNKRSIAVDLKRPEGRELVMRLADGADALVLVTEWNEFRRPDFERMKKLMKSPVIFDGRNVYEPQQMEALGFTYYSMGRSTVRGKGA